MSLVDKGEYSVPDSDGNQTKGTNGGKMVKTMARGE